MSKRHRMPQIPPAAPVPKEFLDEQGSTGEQPVFARVSEGQLARCAVCGGVGAHAIEPLSGGIRTVVCVDPECAFVARGGSTEGPDPGADLTCFDGEEQEMDEHDAKSRLFNAVNDEKTGAGVMCHSIRALRLHGYKTTLRPTIDGFVIAFTRQVRTHT